jgi:hypothetical protein
MSRVRVVGAATVVTVYALLAPHLFTWVSKDPFVFDKGGRETQRGDWLVPMSDAKIRPPPLFYFLPPSPNLHHVPGAGT